MAFERGKDPKESMQIGLKWDSYPVSRINIKILDMSITDDRRADERTPFRSNFRENPQIKGKKRLYASDVHLFLKNASEGNFWKHIFELFPEYQIDLQKGGSLSLQAIVILQKEHPTDLDYPFLPIIKCQEKTLMFQDKFYKIPKLR